MRDLADLLSHFPEGKWRGDEYVTACPIPGCHHKTPKLYISQGNNGSALMHCVKCGASGPQIMEALGLPKSFLFPDDPTKQTVWQRPQDEDHGKHRKEIKFKEIPDTYFRNRAAKRERLHIYRDAAGCELSCKVVYRDPATGKKEIQWFTKVSGGFAPGLCGNKIPLYHLPELLASDPAQTVYFVEGEKDCDTMAALGRLAVSAPNGGNQTSWKDQFYQGLEGRNIVIITDNDETGAKYGAFVAKHITQCAKSVCTIPAASILPQIPDKGDISDIVEILGNTGALAALDQALSKAEKPKHTQNLRPFDFSDAGNAEIFALQYRDDMIFTDSMGWLRWNGQYWDRSDHSALAMATDLSSRMLIDAIQQNREAKIALAEAQAAEQAETGNPEDTEKAKAAATVAAAYLTHAKQTRSASKIRHMIGLAIPRFVEESAEMDAQPADLNTPAGIVDLNTGKIRPHDRAARCTKITAAAPGLQGESMWRSFLDTITQHDGSLAGFLQMVAGMALHGRVYHEGMIIAFGAGRNGKSTFFNALSAVLGDYAGSLDIDTFTTDKQNRGAALATLRGKRLITAGELEEGRRLSVSTVKKICSTDRFVVEEKYKAPETITPSHSIILFTNHLPRVGSNDEGTWRRLLIVPFLATIPAADCRPNFAEDLIQQAGPAIMAWAIEGAVLFAQNKYRLHIPDVVAAMTEDYRGREDWFETFIRECCTRDQNARVSSSELYARYKQWAEESGDYRRRQTDFNAALDSHGYRKVTPHNKAFWIGLELAE